MAELLRNIFRTIRLHTHLDMNQIAYLNINLKLFSFQLRSDNVIILFRHEYDFGFKVVQNNNLSAIQA